MVEDAPRPVRRDTPEKTVKNEEENMKCTHLVKRRILYCRALEKSYVPSMFQLAEYCRSGEHRKCPFYLRGIICVDRMEGNMGALLGNVTSS
jgi:hypothetical protein